MDINERCYGYEPAQSQLIQLQTTIRKLKAQLAAVRPLPEKWENRMETHYLGDDDFLHGRKDANHTCANELKAAIGEGS